MGASRLVGRDPELAQLHTALAEAAEHGGALFVTGAVGIGKTSLLDVAASEARSRGYNVLAVTGLESEADLPYAGLHQLLQPVLPSAGALPGPQKNALLTALGMRAGAPPEVFLVGLATLSLMDEVADERPLVVVADDFQWLDGATSSVLSFVARRLESTHILLISGLRDLPDRTSISAAAGAPCRTSERHRVGGSAGSRRTRPGPSDPPPDPGRGTGQPTGAPRASTRLQAAGHRRARGRPEKHSVDRSAGADLLRAGQAASGAHASRAVAHRARQGPHHQRRAWRNAQAGGRGGRRRRSATGPRRGLDIRRGLDG